MLMGERLGRRGRSGKLHLRDSGIGCKLCNHAKFIEQRKDYLVLLAVQSFKNSQYTSKPDAGIQVGDHRGLLGHLPNEIKINRGFQGLIFHNRGIWKMGICYKSLCH